MQERLQINRMPLDKWSVREQLCLLSAMPDSGDQNWVSISRSLKNLCGDTKYSSQARPTDWFSQNNCAVQCEHLLGEVESPICKKGLSESNKTSSPSGIESLLRKLTEERMQEIKIEIRKGQEEYARLYNDIKSLQNGVIGDDELLQMWNELEKDQEMQRIEEMKLENQLREREFKKQELQRRWRTNANSTLSSKNSPKSLTDTTAVDMDVEEIIGSGRTILQSHNKNTGHTQTGTSPLLSSLLKSPNAGTSVTNIAVLSPSVRNTAPTITTLLTGGSIPNQHQPAIIPSHDEAVQLLARPISGPPMDSVSSQASVSLTLLSPSQSAPTLSMLLEKNKLCAQTAPDDNKNAIDTVAQNSTVNDSNNESVPMDIEEDLTATKNESNSEIQSGEVDDTDPNEEQQLLEVFKNIGNIEELDIDVSDVIDEEVDFLKGVDEDTALDENIDAERKLNSNTNELADNTKTITNENKIASLSSEVVEKSEKKAEESNLESGSNKIEIISSDDSNDNIPLAAVASLESSKDRLTMNESSNDEPFLKDQVESANLKKELDQEETANKSSKSSGFIKQETLNEDEKIHQETAENSKEKNKLTNICEIKDDIFAVPAVEDNKQDNILMIDKKEFIAEKQQKTHIDAKEEKDINDTKICVETENSAPQISNTEVSDLQHEAVVDLLAVSKIQPPPSITIADTDENSSSTDMSVQTRKDEKHSNRGRRKSPHETKTDDEQSNSTIQQMAIPNISAASGHLTPRPTALRKLRDRGRSESPMIDDDATTHSDHSTTNQRSRRRYSSTPVIDSVPNSPASSDRDERDLRTSKKSLLSIYNVLYNSKYSSTLQKVLCDQSSAQKLDEICLRAIDFLTIKKNIESGLIRSVYELQRDILWMCQNALMITKSSSSSFKAILQFQQELQNVREFMSSGCELAHKLERETRDNKSSSSIFASTSGGTSKGRSGSRKSLRLS